MESIFDWDLLLMTNNSWLTDPRHTFLEQDNICFLCDNTKWAGNNIVSGRHRYCCCQAVVHRADDMQEKVSCNVHSLSPFVSSFTHMSSTHPSQKFTTVRLDIGNCGYEIYYNEHSFSDTPLCCSFSEFHKIAYYF